MEKPFSEDSSESEISSSEDSGEHKGSEAQLVHESKKVSRGENDGSDGGLSGGSGDHGVVGGGGVGGVGGVGGDGSVGGGGGGGGGCTVTDISPPSR